MKVTVRALLFNDNETVEAPVKLVVWYNGKRLVHSLNIKVRPVQWNDKDHYIKKTHPNHLTLNRIIDNKISEVNDYVDRLRSQREQITLYKIKNLLKGHKSDDDVYKYAQSLLDDSQNKYSVTTLQGHRNKLERLRLYQNPLYFSQIDSAWLRKYESWLRSQEAKGRKNKKVLDNNTVYMNWRYLKTLINSAIRDGVTDNNPFRSYTTPPKYKQPDRTYLTQEEIERMEALLNKPLTENQLTSLNFFLLSCYSGLRISDLYRFNYKGFVENGRMKLRTKKTGQWVDIPIHKRLGAVLERLKGKTLDISEKEFRECLKTLAGLAGIEKHISPHTGRHTFATRSAELGIPIEATAELLGITIRICSVYYRITNRKIDAEVAKWDG